METYCDIGNNYILDAQKREEYFAVCEKLATLPGLTSYVKWAIPLSYGYRKMCKEVLGYYKYEGDLKTDRDMHRAIAMTFTLDGHLLPLHTNHVSDILSALRSYNNKFYKELCAKVPSLKTKFDGKAFGTLDTYITEKDVLAQAMADDENGNLPPPPPPGYHDGEETWFGGGIESKFKGSFAQVNYELRTGFEQGTPMWHFVRKFFIGATRIKHMMKDDHNKSKVSQTPGPVAKVILGLSKDEPFSPYVKKALAHGQQMEDMARQGYVKLLDKANENEVSASGNPVHFEAVEYGMTVAPYLPIFYAQSPDGVTLDVETQTPVGCLEIKCHWMKYKTEAGLPNIYRGQCLQCMVAFSDWVVIAPGVKLEQGQQPEFDVPHCDFVSMFYRQDTDSKYKQAHDPDIVEFTVERVYKHPGLVKSFVRFLVTYAFYVQLYTAKESVQTPTAQKEVKLCMDLVSAEIERLLIDVNSEFDQMKRAHFSIVRGEETLEVKNLKMDLKTEFFQGDAKLYNKWYGKQAVFPDTRPKKDAQDAQDAQDEARAPPRQKNNFAGPMIARTGASARPNPYLQKLGK